MCVKLIASEVKCLRYWPRSYDIQFVGGMNRHHMMGKLWSVTNVFLYSHFYIVA